jgi:hypothetical protein
MKAITSQKSYREALARADALMDARSDSAAAREFVELARVLENYERDRDRGVTRSASGRALKRRAAAKKK